MRKELHQSITVAPHLEIPPLTSVAQVEHGLSNTALNSDGSKSLTLINPWDHTYLISLTGINTVAEFSLNSKLSQLLNNQSLSSLDLPLREQILSLWMVLKILGNGLQWELPMKVSIKLQELQTVMIVDIALSYILLKIRIP